jgi:hypothetical protein
MAFFAVPGLPPGTDGTTMGLCFSAPLPHITHTTEPVQAKGQAEPRREVADELKPLARYAAQRALVGQPLAPPSLQALRAQEETRLETRAMLRVGRGNVAQDIASSQHECSRRMHIGRSIAPMLRAARPDAADAALAAMSVLVEAGNCEEHARLAMHLHAPKLAPGQQVQMTGHRGVDHVWAEHRPMAGGPDAPRQIIDPWTAGSAIEAEDARPEYNSDRRAVAASITAPQAAAAQASFQSQLHELSQVLPQAIAPMLEAQNVIGSQLDPACVFTERDALHPDFKARAQAEATKGPVANFSAQIATVASARELGASVGGAAQFAGSVVAELAQPPQT